MCLIAFAWKVHPRWPLVVAANRDEFHARPTQALAPWAENPDIVGGRDLRAGGSWLGLRRGGRFAAVTNVRTPVPGPGELSRGELVGDFLFGKTGAAAAAVDVAGSAGRYGPFNLLVGDGKELAWATNRPAHQWQRIVPGVHGVSNGAPSFMPASPWPKVARLVRGLREWLPALEAYSPDIVPLLDLLHDESSVADSALPDTGVGLELERRLAPVFVRGREYGTRCSTVVLVDSAGSGRIWERRFTADAARDGETQLALPAVTTVSAA